MLKDASGQGGTVIFMPFWKCKHNIWVEDFDECGKIILVEGNVFYTEDDVGKIHNSKDIDAQYDDSSKIIYNAEDGSGWINGSKNGVIKDNWLWKKGNFFYW